MHSPPVARLIYNVGNGRGYSVREVIECVCRVTGRSIRLVETGRRAGDPAVLVANAEKIRSELHWLPQHPERDSMVASAWQWMQRRQNGCSYQPAETSSNKP